MNSELLAAGLPPANDRMLTTCFVAALLHAIIILGVTFSPPKSDAHGGAPGLEVILVGDKGPAVAHNRNAKYLAQRNQLGSGNTDRGAAGADSQVLACARRPARDRRRRRARVSAGRQQRRRRCRDCDAGSVADDPVSCAGRVRTGDVRDAGASREPA